MWAVVWWSVLRGQTPTTIAEMLKQAEPTLNTNVTPTDPLEENRILRIFSFTVRGWTWRGCKLPWWLVCDKNIILCMTVLFRKISYDTAEVRRYRHHDKVDYLPIATFYSSFSKPHQFVDVVICSNDALFIYPFRITFTQISSFLISRYLVQSEKVFVKLFSFPGPFLNGTWISSSFRWIAQILF